MANPAAIRGSHINEWIESPNYLNLPKVRFEGFRTGGRDWLLSEVHDSFARHGIIHVVYLEKDFAGWYTGRGDVTYLREHHAEGAVAAMNGTTDGYGSMLSVWREVISDGPKGEAHLRTPMAEATLVSQGQTPLVGITLQGGEPSLSLPQTHMASQLPNAALPRDEGLWDRGGIRTPTPLADVVEMPVPQCGWGMLAQDLQDLGSRSGVHAEDRGSLPVPRPRLRPVGLLEPGDLSPWQPTAAGSEPGRDAPHEF